MFEDSGNNTKTKTNGFTVYVDMDGVIADFDKAMKERGLTGKDLKMIQGIYRQLEVTDGAREGISFLINNGFDLHVATKIPDENPYAATEKLLWLREHFPELAVNVTKTREKPRPSGRGWIAFDFEGLQDLKNQCFILKRLTLSIYFNIISVLK